VLRNAHEPLRQKDDFIAFLINHLSLLMFVEKQTLYSLIDYLSFPLLHTKFADPNVQAEVDELKK